MNWEAIIFVLLLVDSIGAVVMSWFGRNWWLHATGRFSEYFPPAKGWSAVYLLLVVSDRIFVGADLSSSFSYRNKLKLFS